MVLVNIQVCALLGTKLGLNCMVTVPLILSGAQHATEYCRSGFPFLQQALESAATDAEASTPLLSLSHMAQANRDLALGILQLTQKVS